MSEPQRGLYFAEIKTLFPLPKLSYACGGSHLEVERGGEWV
jgi:hypothetical protein